MVNYFLTYKKKQLLIIMKNMEETVKKETILHFIYTKDENAKLNEFVNCVQLEKAKIKADFSSSNDISFIFQLEENNIYYEEIINIILNKKCNNKKISFEYTIYKNKINNIYLDINEASEEIKLISVEIIYQSTKNEFLPKHILYDRKEITNFDSYSNKSQRVGLSNINPEKLYFYDDIMKRYPGFKFENNKFYRIFIFISNEEITEYLINSSELNNNEFYQYQNLKPILDKKASYNLLYKFKLEYCKLFGKKPNPYKIEEIITQIKEFKTKNNNIIKEKDYYENITNYNNFEKIDLEIFNLIFYYFEFLELLKIVDSNDGDRDLKLLGKLFKLKTFNNDFEKYILEIKNLNINILDELIIIKAYNKKFIDSFQSRRSIDYISILDIENLTECNPYKLAINFIKEIISNLKEESQLFKKFLYLHVETKNNKLQFINNSEGKTEVNYENKQKEYGNNMSNLEKIKNHLFELLPKFIIRINTELKFLSDYDRNSKIFILNEKALFNETSSTITDLYENKEFKDTYALPITIEILYEIYEYEKKRFIDNNSSSPELNREINQESGAVFDNFIFENINILRWLRMLHRNIIVKKLLDVSLWIDKDFSQIEKLIKDYIKSNYKLDNQNEIKIEEYAHPFYEYFLEPDNDDNCGFCGFDKCE